MNEKRRVWLDALGDEIAELSAHLQAAMCRWLGLVATFDEERGWESWGCASCAEWLAFRCSISPITARDHVRVARRLQELPLVRGAFSRAELSYSKVRAIARVEGVVREAELLELAKYMTASQLERAVRGQKRVLALEAHRAHEERYFHRIPNDDGTVTVYGRLPAEEDAVLGKGLEAMRERAFAAERAATAAGDSAESAATERVSLGARNADALIALADVALAAPTDSRERTSGDRHQVVVHVEAPVLRERDDEDPGNGRCELDDGTPLAAETVRRLCCDASIVPLLKGADGEPLSVGRKTRSIPPAMRRALRSRDGCCRFPGCHRRHVEGHHIRHWSNGGETSLSNLVSLCRFHHRLVHEGGYRVEARASGPPAFRRPDGRPIPPVAPRPRGDHTVPSRLARRRRRHRSGHLPAGVARGAHGPGRGRRCAALDDRRTRPAACGELAGPRGGEHTSIP